MADAMCGGCGETDPNKACMGCLHFASTPAPAREGVDAETSRLSRWIANGMQDHSDDSERRDALKRDLTTVLAALTAREEAPAEGNAFLSWLESEIDGASLDIGAAHQEGGKATEAEKEREATLCLVREQYQALRARTSEPEAGEAVAWRFREHPNSGWVYTGLGGRHDGCEVQPLYAAPAPASADKLRVVVEAIAGSLTAFPHDPDEGDDEEVEITLTRGQVKSICALAGLDPVTGEPLAALTEGGKG